MPELSARAVARRCGVSHVAVLKAVRDLQMPPLDHIADLDEAERLWNAQADPVKAMVAEERRRQPSPRRSPDGALAKARARREEALATLAEMEVRRVRGELVRRAPLEAALAVQDQALKDRLLMVPITAAAEALAAGRTAGAPGIAAVYERHINRALSDLASAELVSAGAG